MPQTASFPPPPLPSLAELAAAASAADEEELVPSDVQQIVEAAEICALSSKDFRDISVTPVPATPRDWSAFAASIPLQPEPVPLPSPAPSSAPSSTASFVPSFPASFPPPPPPAPEDEMPPSPALEREWTADFAFGSPPPISDTAPSTPSAPSAAAPDSPAFDVSFSPAPAPAPAPAPSPPPPIHALLDEDFSLSHTSTGERTSASLTGVLKLSSPSSPPSHSSSPSPCTFDPVPVVLSGASVTYQAPNPQTTCPAPSPPPSPLPSPPPSCYVSCLTPAPTPVLKYKSSASLPLLQLRSKLVSSGSTHRLSLQLSTNPTLPDFSYSSGSLVVSVSTSDPASVSSSPAGSFAAEASTFTFPLAALPPGSKAVFRLQFNSASAPGALRATVRMFAVGCSVSDVDVGGRWKLGRRVRVTAKYGEMP
ncbi:hypothetical protein TeGR_g8153 [Tetraparma gracilis]|uniref:Uncharacterized protein n=1 Tax=Tetraparma gracilis TaxID=2962635 RepID=A0ABQ6N6M4_9STRA|nr:hypothetical protein TeGR_g8153 [Tetraparma gracilis]